jgi:cytochrome c oxidase subunit II
MMRYIIFILLVILASCSSKQEISGDITQSPTTVVKEFAVVAKQFEFIPSRIEVNEGDVIILRLTSTDVPHGLFISGYNLNTPITPGQESVLKFTADKKGEFPFSCSVLCGKNHKMMNGILVVR